MLCAVVWNSAGRLLWALTSPIPSPWTRRGQFDDKERGSRSQAALVFFWTGGVVSLMRRVTSSSLMVQMRSSAGKSIRGFEGSGLGCAICRLWIRTLRDVCTFEFGGADSCQCHHFGIDPGLGVDRAALGGREFEHDSFRCGEIDRFAEAVIERAHDPVAVGADAVANGKQVFVAIDVEREMLHRTRRDVLRGVSGVGDAFDRLDLGDVGVLHECNRRAVAHVSGSRGKCCRPHASSRARPVPSRPPG